MKWTRDNPLDEYRRANFSKRLHLYLQYRDLRSEFMEIERNGLQPEALDRVPRHRCLSVIRMGNLSHLTGGCMKRLFGIT